MTLSGQAIVTDRSASEDVLIPLLVDDPLRVSCRTNFNPNEKWVLIPLLVDDPLREIRDYIV